MNHDFRKRKRILIVWQTLVTMLILCSCAQSEEPAVQPTDTASISTTPELTPEGTPSMTMTPEENDTPTPSPVPTLTLTQIPTPTSDPTSTPSPTLTPTAIPDPTSTPSPTQTPTAIPDPTSTPSPTLTPTSTPTPSPTPIPVLAEGEVLICEDNFPDEAFRGLISELVDIDQNGILTLEERESLTKLYNSYYDYEFPDEEYYEEHEPGKSSETMFSWLNRVQSLEGVEYFPKLRLIRIDKGFDWEEYVEEYIYSDPEIKQFCSFHAESMPALESLQLIGNIEHVTIKNAPNLRCVYISEYQTKEPSEIVIENCDAVQSLNLFTNHDPKFTCNSMKVKQLSLQASEKFYHALTENLLDLSELEELTLTIRDSKDKFVVSGLDHLKSMFFSGDSALYVDGLNELTYLEVYKIPGMTVLNCNKLEEVYSESIMQQMDYVHFESLPALEVAFMKYCHVKEVFLDTINANMLFDYFATHITFQDNSELFLTRTENAGKVLEKEIRYQQVTLDGMTACDCTGDIGYEIDLNGDGIPEQLYSDETGFYINGIDQGISRMNYVNGENIWNQFWLVDADTSDSKINLILNEAGLEQRQDLYWGDDEEEEEEETEGYPFYGQYLADYDTELRLIGWSEVSFELRWQEQWETNPFVNAEYSGDGKIYFQKGVCSRKEIYGIRTGTVLENSDDEATFVIAEDGMLERLKTEE